MNGVKKIFPEIGFFQKHNFLINTKFYYYMYSTFFYYNFSLKTQNGIELTSVGKLKDDKTFVVSGSYSFTGADGKRYKTRYTADEFGYHPITELDLDIPE